jgi:hypothetical protein
MGPAAWRAAKVLWVAPCSIVGLLGGCGTLLCGGTARRASSTLEFTLGDRKAARTLRRMLPFRAIALGHVIIAVDAVALEELRAHELVHVRQYEQWGPLFFVAYGASAAWQVINGRDAYWHNHFEVQARLLSGR